MSARKHAAPKSRQPRPAISVRPRRGRMIVILVLCLLVLAVISQAVGTIFLQMSSNGIGVTILFAVLYLIGLLYLIGIGWSAVRLLSDRRPSFEANDDGLTLRHLPFLGTISLTWDEIKSVHTTRSFLLTHLCIVPASVGELLQRRNLLLFALNASARLTMRTNTALTISQNALDRPASDLVEQMIKYYDLTKTPQ